MNTIHRVLITVANWTLSAVSLCILCAFVIEQFNHEGHWEYKSLRTTERVISNRFRYNRLTGHMVAIIAVFGVRNRGPPLCGTQMRCQMTRSEKHDYATFDCEVP